MTQPLNKRLILQSQAATGADDLPAAPSVVALVGSSVQFANENHVHPAAGLFGWYGDGSDGDLVLDGANDRAGFTRTGTVYVANRQVNAENITVNAGATMRPGGQIINVRSTLSGSGAATADTGKTAISFSEWLPGAVGGAGGTGVGAAGVKSGDVPGVPGSSGAGGLGASGAGGAAAANNSTFITNNQLFYLIRNPVLAFFGVYGTSDWSQASPALTIRGLAGGSSGGAGGGDGTNSGGKGGNGGQPMVINARKVTGSITFSCPGEAGGNSSAGNTGGGGGGAGGLCIVNTTDATGWTGTITAPGGAGGTKTGTGVAGSAGAAGIARMIVWV